MHASQACLAAAARPYQSCARRWPFNNPLTRNCAARTARTAAQGGIAGSIEVGPEFTTVTAQECAWAGPACMTVEVTTIKTKDISHLRATLPSWINALVRAVRDIQLAAISAKCAAMWGNDLAILPVWPCSFVHDGYLAAIMIANAVISIFRFIVIFFCRKTAVIIGGPGPAKEIVLPTAEEKPEELLQDL